MTTADIAVKSPITKQCKAMCTLWNHRCNNNLTATVAEIHCCNI